MTAIQFRYDFTDEEQTMHPMSLISNYLHDRYPGVVGVESHNKYGEVIKRHMHYNFIHPTTDESVATKFVEAIRKRFQRGYPGRSKGYYSITIVPDVKDRDRFFRYPLKQYEKFDDIPNIINWKYPEDFEVELQWKLASEEYVRDREFLSCRREAKDKRQTTYEKIRHRIQEEKIVFKSPFEIYEYILDYYMAECIPVERHKIRSMVDTISLTAGLLTRVEYYREVMK